jgi:hypothetical protein
MVVGLPAALVAVCKGAPKSSSGTFLPAGYSVTATNKIRADGTCEQHVVTFDPATGEEAHTVYLLAEGRRYMLSGDIVKRPI